MKILYSIVHAAFYLISLLPYRILYILSDILYLIIYYIVRYRRALVRRNITSSLPGKTAQEHAGIERTFYKWLCDYFVETIKLMSVSRKELLRHIEFRNVEQIEQYFDRGQSCAAILGHYCNWELLSATGIAFRRHNEAVCGLIYHPLRNKLFDRLFIKIRQNMGGLCVPKQDTLRYLISFRNQKLVNLFGYIADQTPKYKNIHLWLDFLNHDTPVFTGAERLMKKMNNAVFYVDMERPRRGRYVCTFRLMTDDPASLPEFEITRRFFSMLEQTINRAPGFYLWSHNRWKRTHEEYDRMYAGKDRHAANE